MRAAWALGLVLVPLALSGCILRELPPAPAPAPAPASTAESPSEALARARELMDEEKFEDARVLAEQTLSRANREALPLRTVAELREVSASAQWRLSAIFLAAQKSARDWEVSFDVVTAYEAALAAWERVPGADPDVARVAGQLGWVLAIRERDLTRAEALYRRSLAILARLGDTDLAQIHRNLSWLLDLLDQRCRTAEAAPLLERFERVSREHAPAHPGTLFEPARFRAIFARQAGDVVQAISILDRAIEELSRAGDASTRPAGYERAAYDKLADFALQAGRYDAMLRYVELEQRALPAFTPSPSEGPLAVHFAFAAAGDPRLSHHDREHDIVARRSGETLFPSSLPGLEPCTPESTPATGWSDRAQRADERLEQCADTALPPNAAVAVLMRVEAGRVVAVEAAGRHVAATLLECATAAIHGLAIPGPHDFNFLAASLDGR